MLALSLGEQIYEFVRELRVVEESQVWSFFRNNDAKHLAYELTSLKKNNRLYEVEQGLLSTVKTLPMDRLQYLDTIRAINVLLTHTSRDIAWVSIGQYPTNIMYQTKDFYIYDVTVFTPSNLDSKAGLLEWRRKKNLLDIENDPINHIAVVSDMDMLAQLAKKSNFSQFAIINREKQVELYHLES